MNTRILILGPNFTFPVRLSKRIFSWYPVKNQLSICLRRHGWKETILNFNMRLIKILSIHNTSKQNFWRSFSQVTFFGFFKFLAGFARVDLGGWFRSEEHSSAALQRAHLLHDIWSMETNGFRITRNFEKNQNSWKSILQHSEIDCRDTWSITAQNVNQTWSTKLFWFKIDEYIWIHETILYTVGKRD